MPVDPIRARLDDDTMDNDLIFASALRAVLDDIDLWPYPTDRYGQALRRVIAEHLGVTDVG